MNKNIKKSQAIIAPVKTWRVNKRTNSKKLAQAVNVLQAFSRLLGGDYYLINYYEQKLYFSDPSAIMLCGYSQEKAESMGFDFYEKIVHPKEWPWLIKMSEKAFEWFYNRYEESHRKDFVIYYDLRLINISGTELLIHHELTPLELDANGNPWFALCHVMISASMSSCTPHIVDKKTGERYDFINGEFVQSSLLTVSEEELQIIRYLIAGHTAEKIVGFMNMSSRTLSRRLDILYKKMGVTSKAALVHKAGLYGLT